LRAALGDLRPAKGCERERHSARLVSVFAVADRHLALVGLLLRRLEAGEKIALAFPFDGGAKLDVAACAELAGLEHLHRRVTGGRGDDRRDDVVISADFAGQSAAMPGAAPKDIHKARPARRDFRLIGCCSMEQMWRGHGRKGFKDRSAVPGFLLDVLTPTRPQPAAFCGEI
jgi:hypothetical protein